MKKQDILQVSKLLLSLTSGALLGSGAVYCYQKQKRISPEKILTQVKKEFLKEGPIEGSWIESTPKTRHQFAILQKVYVGGLQRLEDHQMAQYEFTADAKTGSILTITRL